MSPPRGATRVDINLDKETSDFTWDCDNGSGIGTRGGRRRITNPASLGLLGIASARGGWAAR